MITALDTETTLAGNKEPIPRLVCVSIANDQGVDVIAANDPRLPAIVVGVLAGGVALANGPFDLFVLWRALGPWLWPHIRAALEGDRVFDVLTREKLIDIAAGKHRKRGAYNLGAVAARRAGIVVNKSDPWRRRYGSFIRGRAPHRLDCPVRHEASVDCVAGHECGDLFEIVPITEWPTDAVMYAQLDAWATWRVYQEQERARIVNVLGQIRDLFCDAPAQARAHLALYGMTLRGVHTDPDRVQALDALLSSRIAWLEARALRDGLARHKYKKKRPSPVQRTKAAAQAALVEWCHATGKTPMRNDLTDAARARGETQGSIALSKKALEHAGVPRGRWGDPDKRPGESVSTLYDKGATPPAVGDVPWPAAIKAAHALEVYRELGGLRASYSKNIPVLKHPIIRTRYDELVSSGRTSASGFKAIKVEDADDDEDDDESLADFDCELEPGDEWVGTNTQNFGRDGGWRECLIPPPGKRLGSTDYGALELVTDAQDELDLFKHSAIATVLRAGKDPHGAFAAEHILRIPYDAFDKSIKEHGRARQLAKAWNFGKKGAMGEARFIEWAWVTYDVAITPAEHREIDAIWHAARPEVRMTWNMIKARQQVGIDERGRPVYTVIQPRTGRVRGGCGFPDAANSRFQGLGADVAKLAAWLLFCAGLDPASPLFGCYQILFEHDAFSTVIDGSADHKAWPKSIVNATAAIASGACACLGCRQLAEQERLMIVAAGMLCPDVPMKVESTNAERYAK